MKKINLAKKALLPALIAVICSVVALTSVSYAWFTLGTTAKIDSIDVNVVAVDGIQISNEDLETWKGLWSAAEMLGANYNKTTNEAGEEVYKTFNPASTDYSPVAGGLNMYSGEIDPNGDLQLEADTNETNYYAFDLYVRLDKDNTIQLDSEVSQVISSVVDGPMAHLAARIAFINMGTLALEEYDADELKAFDDPVEMVIWEPNSTTHVDVMTGEVSEGQKVLIKGAYLEDGDVTETAEVIDTKDFTDGNIDLFELEAGYTKIRVYIWLEGQDDDCNNKVAEGKFAATIQFAIKEVQEPVDQEPVE